MAGTSKGTPGYDYSDIIDMPHHQSIKHPHMSLHDRAAQFSPFAALTGYEDMVDEEGRLTQDRIEIDEQEREKIDWKLALIADILAKGHRPTVSITYFVPDAKKSGGEYVTTTEEIKKIDTAAGKLVLSRTGGIAKMNVTIDIKMVADLDVDIS